MARLGFTSSSSSSKEMERYQFSGGKIATTSLKASLALTTQRNENLARVFTVRVEIMFRLRVRA